MSHIIPELDEYVAMAALKHIGSHAELEDFYKTGYALPMLCSVSNSNADEFLKCVLKRGDMSVLLDVVDGCVGCISYAFDYLTDYGYVAEFRIMAWTYGLNMKTIFQALYNGNRVLLQEIHVCLAVSPSKFLPNLAENMRYYRDLAETQTYDAIPYVLELSYQLMDATKRRWLGKQLRLLAKALKIKWLLSFVKDFYHNQLLSEEHELPYDYEIDDY